MEQSDADRAAVAREVLTELEQHFRDDPLQGLGATAATVVKWFRDEHYPAPPAPETVTVDDGVFRTVWTDVLNGVRWEAKGDGLRAAQVAVFGHAAALRRIASDARVIRERDARIAELETQLQRALDGAVFHEKRAHHAEQERDAALRALEERANTAGPTGGEKRASVAGSTPAPLVPASPAPVPLGAVVEVEGVEWTRTESGWDGGARWYHDGSTAARALTALYRARHPVATRETVERVAEVCMRARHPACFAWDYVTGEVKDEWRNIARAALTAAGFTLEEGA